MTSKSRKNANPAQAQLHMPKGFDPKVWDELRKEKEEKRSKLNNAKSRGGTPEEVAAAQLEYDKAVAEQKGAARRHLHQTTVDHVTKEVKEAVNVVTSAVATAASMTTQKVEALALELRSRCDEKRKKREDLYGAQG